MAARADERHPPATPLRRPRTVAKTTPGFEGSLDEPQAAVSEGFDGYGASRATFVATVKYREIVRRVSGVSTLAVTATNSTLASTRAKCQHSRHEHITAPQ